MGNKTYKLSKKNDNLTRKDSFSLDEIYGLNQEQVDKLSTEIKNIKEKYDLTDKDILELITKKESFISIPISIFKNDLSPLEALVQYLKENLHYNYHQIALALNRNDRTIWTTYSNAKKKYVKLKLTDELFIPLKLFSNRKLSILENLVRYLRENKEFSLKQISLLLGKDSRTVWTIYSRALKKRKHAKRG